MTGDASLRVGYVVKRYPRYSETFIVNEILAHEAAGLSLEIFALRPPNDQFFQDRIARVRSPVHYVAEQRVKASVFWTAMERASQVFPHFWQTIESLEPVGGDDLHQALLLALAVRQRG
ncbi:MAG: colanic acid biosynthesis glycosyltransferase WcaL, partial [Pirellulales bacterium]